MIKKRDFYFIRHGQTDYNRRDIEVNIELIDSTDIALNAHGEGQAHTIADKIAELPIKTVCCSPLKRAVQTKEIITKKLSCVDHHAVDALKECKIAIWNKMRAFQKGSTLSEELNAFRQQTLLGLEMALSKEGPVLIVAHGGIHWMMCHLMNIDSHEWIIDNCVPVHFTYSQGKWHAHKLFQHQKSVVA